MGKSFDGSAASFASLLQPRDHFRVVRRRRQRLDADLRARAFGDGGVRFRIGHVVGDLVDEMLEIVAALDAEEAALIAVGVDVEHRLLLQLGGMFLGPFGRAEQAPALRASQLR